jgi:hypothetical protein
MKRNRTMQPTRLGVEKLEARDMLSGSPMTTTSVPFINPPATGVPLSGGGFPSDVSVNPAAFAGGNPSIDMALMIAGLVRANNAGSVTGANAPAIDSAVGQMTVTTGANTGIDFFATCGFGSAIGGTGGP